MIDRNRVRSVRAPNPRVALAAFEALEGRRLLSGDGETLSDFYTGGRGEGLNIQELDGYAIATTYGTKINGSTGNSAPPGYVFDPSRDLVGYDPARGGTAPWADYFGPDAWPGLDKEYIRANAPDSANTATTLYSGVKSYNNAIGVDIYEKPVEVALEQAKKLGRSTGLVSSVPINHATPGAAEAHVNRRNKYDADYPNTDNILQQALRFSQPTVMLGGGGHPMGNDGNQYIRPSTYDALKNPADPNAYGYKFIERGPDAARTLRDAARGIDPNAGERLFGLYGARGQSNLPWLTADGDYSNTGLSGRTDTTRPLAPGETVENFIAREVNENPTLADMAKAALDVLGDDRDGFWAMIEGGDIDFAAHDNSLDNMIGANLAFDKAVGEVMAWIADNGGFDKNLLIVTADHDHYLTLNEDFPALLARNGAEAMTAAADPASAGHFWGSDPNVKYGSRSHTNRPVPVYYEGNGAEALTNSTGNGFTAYGKPVPGVSGMVDQANIGLAMQQAMASREGPKNVIVMVGDGMGWEMARATAIAKQVMEEGRGDDEVDEDDRDHPRRENDGVTVSGPVPTFAGVFAASEAADHSIASLLGLRGEDADE